MSNFFNLLNQGATHKILGTQPPFFLILSETTFFLEQKTINRYTILNVVGREYDPPRLRRSLPKLSRIRNYVAETT